jgi:hypothetical protein
MKWLKLHTGCLFQGLALAMLEMAQENLVYGEIIRIRLEVGFMQTNKQRASLKTGQKIVYFFVLPIVALAVVLSILGAVTFNLFLF